jgi:hypothetical protein
MTIKQDKQKVQDMVDKASALELELVWIPKIMSKQTEREVSVGSTIEYNEVGLSGFDGHFISDIYRKIREGEHLTEGQAKACRRVLRKYWRQYLGMMKKPSPTIISGKF